MIEIGIPCWHAKETLPDALNSLVAQTFKRFIVCLSIDGDGEDYTDIIQEYIHRGLKIRVINSDENGGPGMARQRVLDTTMCDYLMYLDADDLYTPRAVEVLLNGIRVKNYDLVSSTFIRESINKDDITMSQRNGSVVTWFHGKIYKVQYLKEKGINFLPGLRTDEDAYFNLIAWNSTKNISIIDEVTYIWRDNKNSITRKMPDEDYYKLTGVNYIHSQVEALKQLFKLNESQPNTLITQEFINIYYHYNKVKFYKGDIETMDNLLMSLQDEFWLQTWLSSAEAWLDLASNLKQAAIYNNGKCVCFYEEIFSEWARRLLKKKEGIINDSGTESSTS